MGRNLGPLNIKDSYEGLVQISGSDQLTDGSGSLISSLDIDVSTATSASHAVIADSALTATSASHALNADNAISSSFATTASFAATASVLEGGVSLQTVLNTGNTATEDINLTGTLNVVGELDLGGTGNSISGHLGSAIVVGSNQTISGGGDSGIYSGINNTITTGTYNAVLAGNGNTASHARSVVIGGTGLSTTKTDEVVVPSLVATSITGSLNGNADSATQVQVSNNDTDLEFAVTFTGLAASGNPSDLYRDNDDQFTFNASTETLSVTNINATDITASNASFTSASIGSLRTVTGSAVIIGDEFIILNADTPTARYAGIRVYDSGSGTPATASLEWDGLSDNWVLVEESGNSGVLLTGPTGSKGSEVLPTVNTLQKGGGHHTLIDSSITDDGSKVEVSVPMNNITLSGSTDITGSTDIVLPTTSDRFKVINDNEKLGVVIRGGIMAGSDEDLSTDEGYNNALFGERLTAGSNIQTSGVLAGREVDFGGNPIEYSAFVATQDSSYDGGNRSIIAGGYQHTVDTEDSLATDVAILGGEGHRIGAGDRNAIVAGYQNTIVEGNNRAIIGGKNNTLGYTSGQPEYSGSVILGGSGNSSEHNNTIFLGTTDIVSDAHDTAYANNLHLTGSGATLTFDDGTTMTTAAGAGAAFPFTGSAEITGSLRVIGPIVAGDDLNVATGVNAMVLSFDSNGTGERSAVLGGYQGTASGTDSVVVGGFSNQATGLRSGVFAGQNASAGFDRSVVIGGSGLSTSKADEVVVPHLTITENVVQGDGSAITASPDSAIIASDSGDINLTNVNATDNVLIATLDSSMTGTGEVRQAAIMASRASVNTNSRFSAVIGGENNTMTGQYSNVIAGGSNHAMTQGTNSTIAGGISNTVGSTAQTDHGFIGGGQSNTLNGDKAAIIAGSGNNNSQLRAVILGGENNTINGGQGGVVAGGINNVVGHDRSVVLGGNALSTSKADEVVVPALQVNDDLELIGDSKIVGGDSNVMIGSTTTTLNAANTQMVSIGGIGNTAGTSSSLRYSAIIGGGNNQFGTNNGAMGQSVMLGGNGNIMNSADDAACIGGGSNTNTHSRSVIIGGTSLSTTKTNEVVVPSLSTNGAVAQNVQALSIAANIAEIDASTGNMFTLTLQNATSTELQLSNQVAGQTFSVQITQNATSAGDMTFDSQFEFEGGTAFVPSSGLGAIDILTFTCFGGGNVQCVSAKNFS